MKKAVLIKTAKGVQPGQWKPAVLPTKAAPMVPRQPSSAPGKGLIPFRGLVPTPAPVGSLAQPNVSEPQREQEAGPIDAWGDMSDPYDPFKEMDDQTDWKTPSEQQLGAMDVAACAGTSDPQQPAEVLVQDQWLAEQQQQAPSSLGMRAGMARITQNKLEETNVGKGGIPPGLSWEELIPYRLKGKGKGKGRGWAPPSRYLVSDALASRSDGTMAEVGVDRDETFYGESTMAGGSVGSSFTGTAAPVGSSIKYKEKFRPAPKSSELPIVPKSGEWPTSKPTSPKSGEWPIVPKSAEWPTSKPMVSKSAEWPSSGAWSIPNSAEGPILPWPKPKASAPPISKPFPQQGDAASGGEAGWDGADAGWDGALPEQGGAISGDDAGPPSKFAGDPEFRNFCKFLTVTMQAVRRTVGQVCGAMPLTELPGNFEKQWGVGFEKSRLGLHDLTDLAALLSLFSDSFHVDLDDPTGPTVVIQPYSCKLTAPRQEVTNMLWERAKSLQSQNLLDPISRYDEYCKVEGDRFEESMKADVGIDRGVKRASAEANVLPPKTAKRDCPPPKFPPVGFTMASGGSPKQQKIDMPFPKLPPPAPLSIGSTVVGSMAQGVHIGQQAQDPLEQQRIVQLRAMAQGLHIGQQAQDPLEQQSMLQQRSMAQGVHIGQQAQDPLEQQRLVQQRMLLERETFAASLEREALQKQQAQIDLQRQMLQSQLVEQKERELHLLEQKEREKLLLEQQLRDQQLREQQLREQQQKEYQLREEQHMQQRMREQAIQDQQDYLKKQQEELAQQQQLLEQQRVQVSQPDPRAEQLYQQVHKLREQQREQLMQLQQQQQEQMKHLLGQHGTHLRELQQQQAVQSQQQEELLTAHDGLTPQQRQAHLTQLKDQQLAQQQNLVEQQQAQQHMAQQRLAEQASEFQKEMKQQMHALVQEVGKQQEKLRGSDVSGASASRGVVGAEPTNVSQPAPDFGLPPSSQEGGGQPASTVDLLSFHAASANQQAVDASDPLVSSIVRTSGATAQASTA